MKTALYQALLLIFLASAAGAAAFYLHPRAPALYLVEEPLLPDEITLKDIAQRWKSDVIWLDARPQDQFTAGHIPGAKPLNEQSFDDQLFAMLDLLQTNTKPIIIYCGGQKCEASRHVREKLLNTIQMPHEHCLVLKGGFPAWQAAQR
jgi:rhodanese-related sulfurtransferase